MRKGRAAMHDDRGTQLLEALALADATLLVSSGDDIVFSSRQGGIAPLLEALKVLPQRVLEAASVADVVVGKAGALLLAHAKVKFVAGKIMSEAGAAVLRAHGIPIYEERSVAMICGRVPGQPCPFEQAIGKVEDPGKAHIILSETAARLVRNREEVTRPSA
jgi:hypothetical protein